MRARVRLLDKSGRVVRDSGWGPWQLGTTNFGRIIQGMVSEAATGLNVSKTITATDAVGRTMQVRGSSNIWLATSSAFTYTRMAWGSGTGTPARGDTQISGIVQSFNLASQTNDEVNGTVTVTGSVVYIGVATFVRRIGLYMVASDASNIAREVLLDHTAVTDTVITPGLTVAVTYQVSY
jgi:hypothetical protein